MPGLDYDDLRNGDYSAFFRVLLSNERGVRLRLNLPDTLVLRDGRPSAWFATNQDGYVVQRPAGRALFEDVRQHLLACAEGGRAAGAPFVAIMRPADGTPKLLTRPALDALCDRLAAEADGGKSGDPAAAPCLLQAYMAPDMDLRFVTSYTNDGEATSCHTFQRRFSRRYLPYRAQGEPPAAAAAPAGGLACAAAADAGADAAGASAGEALEAAVGAEIQGEVEIDEGALADSERRLAEALGPLDPALKMAARRATHGLVQYVQKAHLLTLRGLVCEYARDAAGHLWLLGPLRCDWVSLIPGRGGEPWAAANLTKQPREEESWADAVEDGGAAGAEGVQEAPQQAAAPLASQHTDAQAGSLGAAAPSGPPATAEIADHLLPASALPLPKAERLLQQPGSPGIPAVLPASVGTPLLPALTGGGGSPQAVRSGPRRSPAQKGSPGATAGSPSALAASGGSCFWSAPGGGGGAAPAARASAAVTSQLTKRLVSLEDELLVKSDLAEALGTKVRALEHDKHVVTAAFERVLGGLQGDLADVRGRLEALRRERDGLAAQLGEARQRLAAAEAERNQLRSVLDSERGAAFASLGQFQRQQEDAGVRAARAEAEVRALQERLAEERAACDALKKQMVFYQNAMGGSGPGSPTGTSLGEGMARALRGAERPELKYAETLLAVEDLLAREADPTGERYSLSKVLHTCQGDLHAIFLHYCMLDAGFARYWPPQLTLAGWLAFMKDIGSTNLVPGTRTRSDNTMHVQEATDVFRRYCLRQAAMRPTALPTTTPSKLSPTAVAAAIGGAGDQTPQPARPPSSQSAGSAATTARPFSAAVAASLAGAALSYQGFCAALVHVAAKVARSSAEALEACPFLSEQTRAFVELIVPKAQQVAPIAPPSKKGSGASPGAGAKGSSSSAAAAAPAGSLGPKDAAAREAAAKLPKLKAGGGSKAKGDKDAGGAGDRVPGSSSRATGSSRAVAAAAAAEMSAIKEASREGSAATPRAAAA